MNSDYRKEASEFYGEAKWTFWKIAVPAILLLGLVGVPLTCALGTFGEASSVIREEFGPRELLRKYEWFKDASAALDAKQATITVYQGRFKRLEDDYAGKPRTEWARDDREQWSIWQSEAAGIRASYNTLAADYNSEMSKFNWRFTNVGDLPKGATRPLPREYKPYEEN